MWGIAASLFVANFCYIFLKAFQQKNIQHDNYARILPVSIGMAACEFYIMGTIAVVAVNGAGPLGTIINIMFIGVGAGIGAMCAMYQHNKMRNKKNEVKS
jgi:hypothetical protein